MLVQTDAIHTPNETFRQKYADIMVNFDKQFAEIYHATINAGTSFEEYDTKGRGYGGQLLLVPNKFVYSNIDPTQSTHKSNRWRQPQEKFCCICFC